MGKETYFSPWESFLSIGSNEKHNLIMTY